MSIRNELLEQILTATTEGSGAGFLMPDSATYPFASNTARDTWAAANLEDLVKNSTVVNVSSTTWYAWRGEDNPDVYDSSDWKDVTPIIKGEKGDNADFNSLTPDKVPVVNSAGDDLTDSPLTVDGSGNVSMQGTFTAKELKTSIASLNLGDEKKISGLGEGIEVHDMSRDIHKLVVTQALTKDSNSKAFQYTQGDYSLINIQPVFTETIVNPEFDIFTSLGDQILYGFEVKVNSTQNNCIAKIFRDGQVNPIWEETFNGVKSDTLVLSSPVVLDGNSNYKFSITGEFLGDNSGKMYYSIGVLLSEKQDLLDDSDRVNVDGIQSPNIETGTGLESIDNGDGTVTIETSGQTDVIEFDVSIDATRNIVPSMVGKMISIIQTGSPAAIPIQLYLDDHNLFETGDTIEINASESYVNYYFAVYYYDANGQVFAIYPNNNCKLVRTETSWDIQQDGRFTKTAIRSTTKRGLPLEGDDPAGVPVQGFSFIEHPSLRYIQDSDGNRVIEIDLHKVLNPSLDTVDVVGWWTVNATVSEADILNASNQVQSGDLISHTDGIKSDELPTTTIAMKREETSAQYTYFAYPAGFFTNADGVVIEPTLVNTGVGNSADWVVSTVDVEGVTYRVQRSPAPNFSQQLLTCKLIQEGY